MLLAVVLWSFAALAFDLGDHGVALVGHVPQGLAGPEWPPFDWHSVRVLLPAAFAVTFVGFVESIAIEREYGAEHGYAVDANHELVALGAANVSAGLFQGMIVTGAVTRSSIIDAAGARTQLSGVVTALVVAPLLIFWTDAFEYIPIGILAVIVIVAVVGFVHVNVARRLWRVHRPDFWLLMGSFGAAVALGVEFGVLAAAAASIVMIVYRATNPRVPSWGAFLVPTSSSSWSGTRKPRRFPAWRSCVRSRPCTSRTRQPWTAVCAPRSRAPASTPSSSTRAVSTTSTRPPITRCGPSSPTTGNVGSGSSW